MYTNDLQMSKFLTEDEVRDLSRQILGFCNSDNTKSGVGQLTTFNQLGFIGISDKPDGWYLPNDTQKVAIILETKNSNTQLKDKEKQELLKNCNIISQKYKKVIGILYNGYDIIVYKNGIQLLEEYQLHNKEYYLGLFDENKIDKRAIYSATKIINDTLHFNLKLKNLYHRMIFTACALVAKRYGANIYDDMPYSVLCTTIKSKLESVLSEDIRVNIKLRYLIDIFDTINVGNPNDAQGIATFTSKVNEISNYIQSEYWNGEDVMAIFFNEFNRYKGKSESGQVFTPDHISSFMYRLIEVGKDDIVLDAACGSGAFLVKAMCNMIKEAGGNRTAKAKSIKQKQLYGIELDREIYALACANMLIHKDGKTNLEQLDSRTTEAFNWIKEKNITKVLMNPPFENKYGCLDIVENVLDAVSTPNTPNTPNRQIICAFILPDNKLEKKIKQARRILKRHRLEKIIKLPDKVFTGATTSVFVFRTGVPQGDNEIFGCHIKDDGHENIKNQGRHDIKGVWGKIEDEWIDIIKKQQGDNSIQWINPQKNLSYKTPEKLFEINETDFKKSILDYILFESQINETDFKIVIQKIKED